MITRVTLVIIAALLLAAHFLRQGNFILMSLCAFAPLLLLVKKQWSLFALQLLAYLGAVIWYYSCLVCLLPLPALNL